MEKVFLVKAQKRAEAIQSLLSQFDMTSFEGKKTVIKANYNSADFFPASTHLDTLSLIVKAIKNASATNITLAERSGMGTTHEVLEETGVLKLSEQLSFNVIDLDATEDNLWVRFEPDSNMHWKQGFWAAKVFREADKVVQTCCLKTHRYGGHFTLSLKNSVGLIARYGPKDGNNYMADLHNSKHQRLMIAEVNLAYKTDIIIIDGIEAFMKGGPESGDRVKPDVMLAGRDRVAIDAVGVAILRHFGTTPEVSEGRIFEQQQIARAAELGIGVRSASDIRLMPLDAESRKFAQDIEIILKNEG